MAARRNDKPATAPARATRREAASSDAGAAPASSGLNMVDACMILSAVLLVIAFLLVDKFRGEAFGEGMFFKG